jgi:hypothetical protein
MVLFLTATLNPCWLHIHQIKNEIDCWLTKNGMWSVIKAYKNTCVYNCMLQSKIFEYKKTGTSLDNVTTAVTVNFTDFVNLNNSR